VSVGMWAFRFLS